MASKYAAPCADCGKILPGTSKSLPAGQRRCHLCRRRRPTPRKRWVEPDAAGRSRRYRERLGDIYRERARRQRCIWTNGITIDEWNALVAFQGGVCPLSRAPLTSLVGDEIHTDHAHWVTGSDPRGRKDYQRSPLSIRGVLTRAANISLGHVEDSLLRGEVPAGMDTETYDRYMRYLSAPPAAAWRSATWTPERWGQAIARHTETLPLGK